jgi:hypothetical protein
MVRGTTRRTSGRRNLALAQGGRALVRANGSRARGRSARPAPTLLESGAASGDRRPTPAVLQSRAEPAALVGHAIRLGRWRAHLACGPASAPWVPRPDQEQAGGPWRRLSALSVQHRASGLARASRAHCGPRCKLGEAPTAQQVAQARRHPAVYPRLSRRSHAGALPHTPARDRGVLVERPPCRTRTAASTRLRSAMVAPCSRTTRRGQRGLRFASRCRAMGWRGAMFSCSRTGSASIRIRPSSRGKTVACTSPTRGTAGESATYACRRMKYQNEPQRHRRFLRSVQPGPRGRR